MASPEREGFVGRAADLVSSARGFLGSIWNSSSSSSSSAAAAATSSREGGVKEGSI